MKPLPPHLKLMTANDVHRRVNSDRVSNGILLSSVAINVSQATTQAVKNASRSTRKARADIPPPTPPERPTPEREAKARAANGIETFVERNDGASHRNVSRAVRVRSPIEAYSTHFELWEQAALIKFAKDAEMATRHNITSNFDANGGGSSANSKLGGLGDVHERCREAHTRHQAVLRKMHPKFVQVAEWLVLEVRSEQYQGRCLSMAEVAAEVFPTIKDKAMRQGISLALMKTLSWELDQFYARERALTKPLGGSDPRFKKGTAIRIGR